MKKIIISILISLGVGGLAALITSGDMDIYSYLVKPALAPPKIVFPIVWTILYILMGISSYLVYKSDNPNKDNALLIYGIQLFLNFCWSIIFFSLNYRLLAFIWIIGLLITIIVMIIKFYKINKTSAYLQIPYLLWTIFATYLTYMIYILNK